MSLSFGGYLRAMRLKAGKSLRAVAEGIGISHVLLSEVEREVRPTLAEKHWPTICAVVPGVTMDDLARHAEVSKPVQMRLSDAPPKYQDLGLALARRIRDQDLKDTEIKELLRILGKDDDDE